MKSLCHIIYYFVLFSLILSISAKVDHNVCKSTCYNLVGVYKFNNCTSPSADEFYYCQCHEFPSVGSLALCHEDFCDDEKARNEAWNEFFEIDCAAYNIHPSLDETLEKVKSMELGPAPEKKGVKVFAPFRVSEASWKKSYRTTFAYWHQIYNGREYGAIIVGYFGIIVLLAMANRIINAIRFYRERSSLDEEAFAKKLSGKPNKLTTLWRKHIGLPAFYGSHHVHRPTFLKFPFSIPTRLETFHVINLNILNFVLLFTDYDVFSENVYWPSVSYQLGRYISDRSGIMAFALMPLIFLTAGRNNFLLWMTGWSYSTMNVYHKHISRIFALDSIIHSIGYTILVYRNGFAAYKAYFAELYWSIGVAGTVILAAIIFQAMYIFRYYRYELFLVLHIVFAAVFLVTMWYHVNIFDKWYLYYIYASFAVWVFDRLARIARIIWLNVNLSTKSQSARVELAPGDSQLIKMHLYVDSSRWKFKPGHYIYIYLPRFNFWESHPFTVLDYDDPSQIKTNTSMNSSKETIQRSNSASSNETAVNKKKLIVNTADFDDHRPRFILLIRVYDGFTRKLANYLDKQPDKKATLKVYAEGPYGHNEPLQHYNNIALIAGGSGITAVYPYLKAQANRTFSQSRIQQLHFLWVIHNDDGVTWIKSNLETIAALKRDDIHIHIYLSKGSKHDYERGILQDHIQHGRPDLTKFIDKLVKEAAGSTAIMSCGPGGLADECRAAVVKNLDSATADLQYFEEAFNW